jgi:hypothetical protein
MLEAPTEPPHVLNDEEWDAWDRARLTVEDLPILSDDDGGDDEDDEDDDQTPKNADDVIA